MRRVFVLAVVTLAFAAGCSKDLSQTYACETQVKVREDQPLSQIAAEFFPGRDEGWGNPNELAEWQQLVARRNYLTVEAKISQGETMIIPTKCSDQSRDVTGVK